VPELQSAWEKFPRPRHSITAVSQYGGEPNIAIAATQLGARYTRTQASRIVQEWVDFFSSGPSPIVELHFTSRTPKRLFNALRAQTQLEGLFVKWGDYDDLGTLSEMASLRKLRLRGASSVADVSPVTQLRDLTHLQIESLRRVHDLSPLARLRELRQLDLGGDWASPRIAHIDSIAWLPALEALEHLLLHTIIVDDRDYTPLLRLPRLQAIRVMATRGMNPPIAELRQQLPWAG
jgi:hypothetical protein